MDEELLVEVEVMVRTSAAAWSTRAGRDAICYRTRWQHVAATLFAAREQNENPDDNMRPLIWSLM